MKLWLCALSATAILAAGSAFAADLSRGPPPPPLPPPLPAFSWTGPYLGINVGYGWGGESDDLSRQQIPQDAFDAHGVLGGVQAGYNWQMNQLVLGVEADIDATGVQGVDAPVTGTLSFKNTWQSSLRLRAGYAVGRWLIYATGGVAFADDKEIWTVSSSSYSQTKTLTGWTAGGGVEYAITNNWIGRIEARYTDFGKATYTLDDPPFLPFQAGFHETTALVGLSYLF
jgi:outer membrane immunogenic protein